MNHPKPEEWLPYLEGEASAETAGELSAHLEHCPGCAAEIAGWRRSIQALRGLPCPLAPRLRWRRALPLLKYGAAAVFVLSLGFGIGRLSAASQTKLKAAVVAQVKQELRQELQDQLLASRDQDWALQRVLSTAQKQCEQDRRDMWLCLNQFQQQNVAALLSLRRDLETAAWQADADLKLNSRRLAQLATTLYANNSRN